MFKNIILSYLIMYVGNYKNFPIYLSDKKLKKYYAVVNDKKVYFGDSRYQQYHDKMGYYKKLDHWDTKRRSLFNKRHYKRHYKNKNKIGTPTWFSSRILW